MGKLKFVRLVVQIGVDKRKVDFNCSTALPKGNFTPARHIVDYLIAHGAECSNHDIYERALQQQLPGLFGDKCSDDVMANK